MKLILAGSYQEFREYCKENNLVEGKDAAHITSAERALVFDYTMDDVIIHGTFWDGYRAKLFRAVQRHARPRIK